VSAPPELPAAAPHVDVHVHSSPPSFRRALATAGPDVTARFGYLEKFAGGLVDADHRIAEMDAARVGLALLSVPPPAAEVLGPTRSARLAADLNDDLLADARQRPERCRVLLTVPVSDPLAALREVERVGDDPLVAGVYALAHHRDAVVDDRALDDVWAAAAQRGLPVVLHPAFEQPPVSVRDWLLPTSLDAVFSTTIAAARMMLSGTLDRVPAMTLVVPHLGGTLPYLAQRLVDQSGTGDARFDVAQYLRTRVLVDTCSFHPPALRCAVDTMGADRVLLGSDAPFRGPIVRAVTDVEQSFLGEVDQRLVLSETALATFRIPAAAPARAPALSPGGST
jgi:aminocarboxymuconate-semialdehyde decarboxylase